MVFFNFFNPFHLVCLMLQVSALMDKLSVALSLASATHPTSIGAMESWIVLLEKTKWTVVRYQ